jgi:hypothetical protein
VKEPGTLSSFANVLFFSEGIAGENEKETKYGLVCLENPSWYLARSFAGTRPGNAYTKNEELCF